MKTKDKKGSFYSVFYLIALLGIFSVIVLRILNIIQNFDMEYVYLILIFSGLAVIPQFKKVSVNGFEFETTAGIEKAEDREIKNNDKKDEEELKNQLKKSKVKTERTSNQVKECLLSYYCSQNNVSPEHIERNRRIVTANDPINRDYPIFSWYLRKEFQAALIEAKITEINTAYYNKLYTMLSKINLYNQSTSRKLYLIMLVPEYDADTGIGVSLSGIENLKDVFSPALDSKLLKIIEIKDKSVYNNT